MRIDIVGGGSLGLLFFSKLALSWHTDDMEHQGNDHQPDRLHLWTRTKAQAQHICQEGILFQTGQDQPVQKLLPTSISGCSVAGVEGSFKLEQAAPYEHTTPYEHATETITEKADLILLTVKQQHVNREFIQWLSERVHKHTIIVTMQNGLRTDRIWPDAWQVYVAVTTEGAKKLSPVWVVHSGHGATSIGDAAALYGTSAARDMAKSIQHYDEGTIAFLLKSLTKAGFNASLSKDIKLEVYRKLMINAVINPLTALWRIANGELLASKSRIMIMRQLFDEAAAVYGKNDIGWSESWWNDILQVCCATSANTSSMLADVLNGRPTEISWINGAIIGLARRANMKADAHEWMCRLIESLTTEEAD
ncbi:ketopantoate reductase family protein [Paenibacillus wenxiniae]|uniref:2-dehydropantoate 2-reductase n=1 Tax=Paenibacillus wenxiniae TaxID=1636843 RepID=A0ABW4RGS2_9BACL